MHRIFVGTKVDHAFLFRPFPEFGRIFFGGRDLGSIQFTHSIWKRRFNEITDFAGNVIRFKCWNDRYLRVTFPSESIVTIKGVLATNRLVVLHQDTGALSHLLIEVRHFPRRVRGGVFEVLSCAEPSFVFDGFEPTCFNTGLQLFANSRSAGRIT